MQVYYLKGAFTILTKCVVMNILLSFLKMQHCFFVLQRDAEVNDAITGFAQPQILIAGDIFDIDLIYIVAEGRIICQLPQKSILDALLGLLGNC